MSGQQGQESWHDVAAALRDIVRQVQDAVDEAGLMPALVRAEGRYRQLAEADAQQTGQGADR